MEAGLIWKRILECLGLSQEGPQVGFEPTTSQLIADHSTTELLRNNGRLDLIKFNSRSQPMTNMSSKFLS
jgi:hypothetical protein